MSEQGKGDPPGGNPPDPATALKQGLGLLWQAARAAGQEIKREVEKAGIKDHIKAAGQEIENAAKAAAKELEDFIAKVQPPPPGGASGSPTGAPGSPTGAAPKDERADADAAPDGGTDAKGEPRDMRIQIDDD